MQSFTRFTMSLVSKTICAMSDTQTERFTQLAKAKHKINKINRQSASYAFRLGAIQAVSQSTAKEYTFY